MVTFKKLGGDIFWGVNFGGNEKTGTVVIGSHISLQIRGDDLNFVSTVDGEAL